MIFHTYYLLLSPFKLFLINRFLYLKNNLKSNPLSPTLLLVIEIIAKISNLSLHFSPLLLILHTQLKSAAKCKPNHLTSSFKVPCDFLGHIQ